MTEPATRPPEEELAEEVEPAQPGESGLDEDEEPTAETPGKEEPTGLEKALKDTKAALTREQQAKADLRREMDELKGQVQALTAIKGSEQEAKPEENPLAFLDDPQYLQTLLDEPENVADAIKRMSQFIGNTLRARDAFYASEFQKRDPEVKRHNEKIAELRKNPALAHLDDATLAAAITAMKPEEEEEDEPPPAPGSLGPGRTPGRPRKDSQMEAEISRWEKRLGYDKIKETQ